MKVFLALFAVSGMAMGTKSLDVKSLDKDQDGLISVQEAAQNPTLSSSFKILDKNSDEKLDADELAKFQTEPKKTKG